MAAASRLRACTRTTAHRHDSIPAAVTAPRALGPFEVTVTEDPAAFERPLDDYAAVVFLATSGEVLTPAGREHLAAHVESGGGFAGVHAVACAEYDRPYYGDLLGARFDRHPAHQPGKAVIEDRTFYEGGGTGADHRLARCHEKGEGRDFCTALGHAAEAYEDPDFRAHLPGGINWAARPGTNGG